MLSPESISFYGGEYEGDGFFWCLDKSCSMAWGGRINVLKLEITSAINQLTPRQDIGLVAFSGNFTRWQAIAVPANVGNKASAIAWVQSINPAGATNMSAPGVATVNLANSSMKRKNTIIVVGDGQPQDPGPALQNITGANWKRFPVNTILVGGSGAGFMRSLAEMNGGEFREVF